MGKWLKSPGVEPNQENKGTLLEGRDEKFVKNFAKSLKKTGKKG